MRKGLILLYIINTTIIWGNAAILYHENNVVLRYECHQIGTEEIQIQDDIKTYKKYRLTVKLSNKSGKDIYINGYTEVSFFIVAVIAYYQPTVTIDKGVLKNNSNETFVTEFLLQEGYHDPGFPSWSMPPYSFLENPKNEIISSNDSKFSTQTKIPPKEMRKESNVNTIVQPLEKNLMNMSRETLNSDHFKFEIFINNEVIEWESSQFICMKMSQNSAGDSGTFTKIAALSGADSLTIWFEGNPKVMSYNLYSNWREDHIVFYANRQFQWKSESGTLGITNIDNGKISGTFSGSFTNQSGEVMFIRNGSFTVNF